jgi:hypothetical protein
MCIFKLLENGVLLRCFATLFSAVSINIVVFLAKLSIKLGDQIGLIVAIRAFVIKLVCAFYFCLTLSLIRMK